MLVDAGTLACSKHQLVSCLQHAAGPLATANYSCTQNRGLFKVLGA